MELESLFGLPAHPLLVHAAVVLVPLAAVGTIAIAVWGAARRRIGWIVVALGFVAFGSALLAQSSGESLEEQVDETELAEEHGEMGESMPWFALPIPILATGVMVLDRKRAEDVAAGVTHPTWMGPAVIVVSAAAVLASVVGTVKIAQVGHSGAKATWEDVEEGGEGGESGESDERATRTTTATDRRHPRLQRAGTGGSCTTASRPPPGASRRSTWPPSACTSFCTMARPRPLEPVPSRPCQNRSKARSRWSGVIPGPWSATWIAGPVGVATTASRMVEPPGDTSRALSSRLSRTWLTRSGVARPCSDGPASTTRSTPRSSATGSQMSRRSASVGPQVDDLGRGRGRRLVGPGQGQQPVDQAGHAVALLERGGQLGGRRRLGVGLQVLQAEAEGGQRGPQLVGGVGHERVLGPDQLLQPPGGVVERPGEGPDLRRALVVGGVGAQVTGTERRGRGLQLP